jgi:hypothetical protein
VDADKLTSRLRQLIIHLAATQSAD